jgi:hypothetical protein
MRSIEPSCRKKAAAQLAPDLLRLDDVDGGTSAWIPKQLPANVARSP